nr:unnamed protein product [Callosobruchus analis]
MEGATSFIFWADNCTSQNKNWIMDSSLVHVVNQQTRPQQVIIRYLTKGHTHMYADSPDHTFMSTDAFHHQVELSLKKARKVLDFDDLKSEVQNSNSSKVKI